MGFFSDWIMWLVGLLGLGGIGIAAMMFFAPSLAWVIIDAIKEVLVALLRTRVGVGILAIVIGLIVGDIHRSRIDAAAWKKAEAKAEQARQQRDSTIADVAKAEEKSRADELEKQTNDLAKLVEDYEKTLNARANCILGDDDIKRLRNIK